MKPTMTSLPVELLKSAVTMADLLPPKPQNIGPGQKTLDRYHKGNSRYCGVMLRRLRAERGVGRPPHKIKEAR